jgi:hypothetical protein
MQEVVAMIKSYLQIAAAPGDSTDCPSYARGRACGSAGAARSLLRRCRGGAAAWTAEAELPAVGLELIFCFNGVLPVAFGGLSGPFKLPSRACKKSWCVGGDVMSSDSSGGLTRWPSACDDLWPVDSRTHCQLLA